MKNNSIEKKPKLSSTQKKLQEFFENQEYENLLSNHSRARSVTIGTCFGGTTEVMMRGDGGRHMWCAMQPVEVIELIHQLASNVGCHIAIKPREDFSSWRDWKVSEAEKLHMNGWAPFANDMAPFNQLGANMQKYEEKLLLDRQQQKENNLEDNINKIMLEPNLSEEEKIHAANNLITEIFNRRHGKDTGTEEFLKTGKIPNTAEIKNNRVHIFGGEGGVNDNSDNIKILELEKLIESTRKKTEEKNEEDFVATKKTVNRRSSKRPSTSS